LTRFTLIDLVILIAVVFAVSSGYRRGFWLSLAQYAGLVLGVVIGAAVDYLSNSANEAFNRALRCRPKSQQEWLRSREMMRLDAVASRVRQRDDLSVEEVIRRLRGVKQQRKTLFVA